MKSNPLPGAAAAAAIALSVPLAAQELAPGMNRVEFHSQGERMVGQLFLPESYRAGDRVPAVVVTGPWLTVKEQVAGTYARELAARGVAALAFDFRFWGESGGEPRQFESPRDKVADIHAAVAFLRSLPQVDAGRIGALGICFSAGYVARAAADDPSIGAVATVAAWLHDPASLEATFGAEEIGRRRAAGEAALRRWASERAVDYVPAHSTTDRTAGMFNVDYYTDPSRGNIAQWTNRMAVMSWPGWLDLDGPAIAPRVRAPLMVVHSDGSALPENARRFHAGAAGPKELVWLEGNHTDFYDRPAHVARAADAVARHFRATLGAGASSVASPASSGDRERNRAVVEEFFAALEAMDIPRFLAVWAEDGVQEMPFSPAGFPRKLEGRAAIANQYGSLPENYRGMRFPREILAMEDPARFLVRYTGSIELKSGGRYDNRYVGLFTVRDGKVAEFVEYFDPIILQNAFGDALQRNFNVAGDSARSGT